MSQPPDERDGQAPLPPATSEDHDPWAFLDAPRPPEPDVTAPYAAVAPPAPEPGPAVPPAAPPAAPPTAPPAAPRPAPTTPPPAPTGRQQYWTPSASPDARPYGPEPHPSAGTALVLSLVGLIGGLLCLGLPLLVSPFAWRMGSRAVRQIDAEPGRWSGREQAMAAKVLGIIGTVVLVLGLLVLVAGIALFFAAVGQIESPVPTESSRVSVRA